MGDEIKDRIRAVVLKAYAKSVNVPIGALADNPFLAFVTGEIEQGPVVSDDQLATAAAYQVRAVMIDLQDVVEALEELATELGERDLSDITVPGVDRA